MQLHYFALVLCLVNLTAANINGPYLLWGHEKVLNLQPRALVEASEAQLSDLFRDVKAVVIFVHNSTRRLDGQLYPKFQRMIKTNAWTYLPQQSLAADPFNYNANIEVINLSGPAEESDSEIVGGYADALSIYGEGDVLGILASREEEAHFLAKREAKADRKKTGKGEGKNEDEKDEKDDREEGETSTPNPLSDETDESYIFVAEGKAVLYVNDEPELYLNNTKHILKEHNKGITFDDHAAKGYGRMIIIFRIEDDKLFLRIHFTLKYGTWSMKGAEVEFKDYKTFLPVEGNSYSVPYAPLKFSYRCSALNLTFSNGTDSLIIRDYQVQPWLNGAAKFGDVYDCVGFTTAPIWAGVLVSLFLCGILSIGIMALMDIKPPNRFESTRSQQLTFAVQE